MPEGSEPWSLLNFLPHHGFAAAHPWKCQGAARGDCRSYQEAVTLEEVAAGARGEKVLDLPLVVLVVMPAASCCHRSTGQPDARLNWASVLQLLMSAPSLHLLLNQWGSTADIDPWPTSIGMLIRHSAYPGLEIPHHHLGLMRAERERERVRERVRERDAHVQSALVDISNFLCFLRVVV